jgi:hypothetical protein
MAATGVTAKADALAIRPRAARRDLGKAGALARTVSFGIVNTPDEMKGSP